MTTALLAPRPRSRAPILAGLLLESWRGLLFWCLGIAAVIGIYLPLFPGLQTPELQQLIEGLPDELVTVLGFDKIASGSGYTQATFFGLLGFVLAAICCVSWGAAYVAGAEESGRLELTLAHAVSRSQFVFESSAALALKALALGAFAFLLILLVNGSAELQLSATNVSAATLAWVGLSVVAGSASLAVGAAAGRRSWALGAGASIAVVAYVLDAVGNANNDLNWLNTLSPYAWAFGNDPLSEGFDWGGLGLLWGLSCALVAGAVWAFSRRDVLG